MHQVIVAQHCSETRMKYVKSPKQGREEQKKRKKSQLVEKGHLFICNCMLKI